MAVNGTAVMWGGPMHGRRVPREYVPWGAWVPREPGDMSPPRTLTADDIINAEGHYRLISWHEQDALYVWRDGSGR